MDRKLLEKYFTGARCTNRELHEIKVYLENPDELLSEFLSEQWQQAGGLQKADRKQKSWENILAATGQTEAPPANYKVFRQTNHLYRWVAAAIVLVLLGGILFFYTNDKQQAKISIAQWKTLQNQSDQVRLVTMPDGSRIWLNSHSELSYAADYSSGNVRRIRLSGEAFFDVAKQADRPFIIYTDSLQTTVLGTSFAIRAWPRISNIRVALVTGSIQVKGINSTHWENLTPGDLLLYAKSVNTFSKTTGGLRPDMHEWKDGKIVLANTPVIEALLQLEQQYNVTIHFNAAQIGNRKLTGKFKREGIDTVLQNILFAAGLSYSKKDGIYTVTAE